MKPKEKIKKQFRTNINVTRSAMFPVWFMSYRNKDRVAYATVNGQTGKVSADIPMSVPKYFVCAAWYCSGIVSDTQDVFTITPDILAVLVAIFGRIVSVLIYGSEMKKIVAKENYDDDLGMQSKIEEKKKQGLQAQKRASDERERLKEAYSI